MFKVTTAPQDPMIVQFVPILIQACEILREEYQRYCAGEAFNIETKNDDSPVTQADYRVNSYLTDALAAISDLPLLSEEGQDNDRHHWKEFWLLDPLDGTKEFLHKRPEFTINLSLVQGYTTIFAILAVPAQQVIYFCPEVGMPLKYNYQKDEWQLYQPQQIIDADIKVGLSHSSQKKGQYQHYLQALSQFTPYVEVKSGSAYKFCLMLEGFVDLYPRFHPTSEWDTSAGQCMLERIGGGIVDFQQRPFVYNQRDELLNGGFMAFKDEKTKHLAFQALAIIRSDN